MKIKKLLAALSALVIAASCCPMSAFASVPESSEGNKVIDNVNYGYRIVYTDSDDNGYAVIMSCEVMSDSSDGDEAAVDIVIPSEIRGYPVTRFGNRVFRRLDNIASITVPDSVKSIGSYSFAYCTASSVILPEGITEIESGTFCGCANLKSIVIPEGVTEIGGVAFDQCTSLTSVSLPETLVGIGNHSFRGCALTSVTIPQNVEFVDAYAFAYCKDLESVTVLSDKLKTFEYSALSGTAYEPTWTDGAVYINNCLVKVDNSFAGEYKIKEGTISVSPYAFDGCTNITSVYIPRSMSFIALAASVECGASKYLYDGTRKQWNENISFMGYNPNVRDNLVFLEGLGYIYGDVDDNGVVNLLDILRAKKYAVGLIGEDEVNLMNGDLDFKDDGITATDIALLKRMIAAM